MLLWSLTYLACHGTHVDIPDSLVIENAFFLKDTESGSTTALCSGPEEPTTGQRRSGAAGQGRACGSLAALLLELLPGIHRVGEGAGVSGLPGAVEAGGWGKAGRQRSYQQYVEANAKA